MNKILLENNAPREFGCLMAYPPAQFKQVFVDFAKKIVSPDILFTDPNDPSYGYEEDFHCTLKYGFKPDLTKKDIAQILEGMSPFEITLKSISLFKNEEFTVVKFDVEKTEVLTKLRERCDKFPNEDKYPTYHPHSTIAYVKPNTFKTVRSDLNIKVPITRIRYSGANGSKLMINL